MCLKKDTAALLEALIEQKGLEKSQVVRQAQMSEVCAQRILSGTRLHPARNKVTYEYTGEPLS